MKYCTLIIAIFFSISAAYSQNSTDSDPEAKKILKNLKAKYDSYTTMEIQFDLLLDLPDQASENQAGLVKQKGKKYYLEMEQQAVYCDGSTVWVHLKDNNEVQINDVEETPDDSFLTPQDMMQIYDSEDFYYAITNKRKVGSALHVDIEFKPLMEDSEYRKLRITVDNTGLNLKKMEVFSADGSKYTLTVMSINPNPLISDATFVFDSSKFPGIHVEDLRF